MTARTWTREQTEETLEALSVGGAPWYALSVGGAPWYADVLDAYEDLIYTLTLAFEASGSLEHCQRCPGLDDDEEAWEPKGCQHYAEHEAYRLLTILGKVN